MVSLYIAKQSSSNMLIKNENDNTCFDCHWNWSFFSFIHANRFLNFTSAAHMRQKTNHHCQRQAITWANATMLSIRTLRTNYSEILSKIHTFSFKKMHLKVPSAKWRQFYLGLNVLKDNYVSNCSFTIFNGKYKKSEGIYNWRLIQCKDTILSV